LQRAAGPYRRANKRHSASSGGWVRAQFSGVVGSA
jgi:hypothetical protein